MQDFVESDQETVREILATSLGHLANHYRKGVRRRMQRPLWESFSKRVADSNERDKKKRGFICGTAMLEASESRLYRRHARLLLLLLQREGVYVVNIAGQVFDFLELRRQFGKILRRLEDCHYEELREIGAEHFDELNLNEQLIREHFSRRAESFIATAAEEEGLYFFFIGAVAAPYQGLV